MTITNILDLSDLNMQPLDAVDLKVLKSSRDCGEPNKTDRKCNPLKKIQIDGKSPGRHNSMQPREQ